MTTNPTSAHLAARPIACLAYGPAYSLVSRPAVQRAAALAGACLSVCLTAPAVAAPEPPNATQNAAGEAAANLLRGNTAQAITLYTEALKDQRLTNDRRGAILNDRAVAYARSGQAKLAIDDFNRSIQLFPEHAATYNNRGNLLLALGLPKEAIRDFDRAVLLSPGFSAAYANRAASFDKLGQADDALRDYTRAIELIPQSAVPLAGRGRVLLSMGRPHSAIRDFTRAANADARFANAYRGRATAKLRIQRYAEAIEDFSRAIAFDNGNTELYLLRGGAYLGVRNFASAVRDYARAIEIDPKLAPAYAGRGLAHGYLEAFDDAFADLAKAIETEPRNPLGYAYRGVVYSEVGQTEVGMKDIETALKLDPNRAATLWARSVIAEAQGRNQDAIPDVRRAVDLDPEFALAAESLKRLGGDFTDSNEVVVAGGGIQGWNLIQRGNEYFAVSVDQSALRVPLESPGSGQPKLLDWEVRKAPFRGIGVLRFEGGTVPLKSGPQPVAMTAIVDIATRSVVAVEPHQLGSKSATWTWDDGKVIVASVDGITDEFVLRPASGITQTAGGIKTPGGADVTPLDEAAAATERPKTTAVRRDPPRQQKPKTIFDLLFGN